MMVIGEHAVVSAFGASFEGTIVDETKNMLVLLSIDDRRVMLPKEAAVMQMDDRTVEGKDIRNRVWERVCRGRNKKCQRI
jgi:RNase P/RNase MRP subunit p29